MEKTYLFVVFGLKWWDKINGNTYNSSVIITPNGERINTEYDYGYGSSYYFKSVDAIKNYCNVWGINFNDIIIRDLGSCYTTKKKAKEHIVY